MVLNPQLALSIQEVEVTFGFDDFDCDPEAISIALGIIPDEIRRKGESLKMRSGRSITVQSNSWSISSRINSKDVNDHCRDILNRLTGRATALDVKWGKPGFSVYYAATHFSAGSGPFYESDVIQGMAALGAELWQDIYSLDSALDEAD